MLCPNCGAQNSPGRNFCYVCATPLTEVARPGSVAPTDPPPNPAPTGGPTTYAPPPTASQPAHWSSQAAPPSQPSTPTFRAPATSAATSTFPMWMLAALVAVAFIIIIVALPWLTRSATPSPPANPTAPHGKASAPPTAIPRPTAPPPARVRPGDQLLVPRASRPPTLDGVLTGDWAGEGYPVDYVVYGLDNLSGPTDVVGRLWFAWDDQAFYVATLVQDDVHSQPARGETMYLGDSLEIQWDVDLQGDFDSNEFNADDWHIGLSPGNFRDLPPEAIVWTPRVLSGTAAGIQIAAQRVTTAEGRQGYTLEALIPWRLVNVVPRGGEAFGFTFSISDNDLPTPVQQSMISTAPNREWHNPLTFNTLILQP